MCGHHHRPTMDEGHRTATTLVRARPDERVTDRDRDRVVKQLTQHVGQGRLTLDEFDERVDEALEARTGAELAAVLRELPRLRTVAELRARQRSVLLPYLLVSALLVTIWTVSVVASGGFVFPWPLFPLLFWGAPAVGEWSRLRRREHELAA
jgi:hypothetical protein